MGLHRVLCSDGWPGYDGLVDVGYDKHVRINKQKFFANGRAHINGIEASWSFAKRRLAKFNGVKTNGNSTSKSANGTVMDAFAFSCKTS
jgi:hypothetical protein